MCWVADPGLPLVPHIQYGVRVPIAGYKCAEEAEKGEKHKALKKGQGRQAKHQKASKQPQKRKNKKPARNPRGDAGASSSVAAASQGADDSEGVSEGETSDTVTASGEHVTASRVNGDLLNIVHSSFQARMEAKRSTVSTIVPASPFLLLLCSILSGVGILQELRSSWHLCSDHVCLPCSGNAR